MKKFFTTIWETIKRVVGKGGEVKTSPPKRQRKKGRGEEVERAGQWFFKRDILDNLTNYFEVIQKMRGVDPGAYALYSKVGAIITTSKGVAYGPEAQEPLPWGNKRLGFGAMIFSRKEEKKDIITPTFMCFTKQTRAIPEVQNLKGTLYKVTIIYTRLKSATPISMCYHVSVNKDGKIILLKERSQRWQRLPGRTGVVHHFGWDYPSHTKTAGKLVNKEQDRTLDFKTVNEGMFRYVYDVWSQSQLNLRVVATKDDLNATFAVDLLRTPYFFDERDPVYTEEGHKKRIFHIVKGHGRVFSDGKRTNVKSHFRGLRKFTWHGYEINITMPGFHHADILNFEAGSGEYSDDEIIPSGTCSLPEMAEGLAQHLKK